MIQTNTNQHFHENDNSNNRRSCLAEVYLYILELDINHENNCASEADDKQDEEAGSKPDES